MIHCTLDTEETSTAMMFLILVLIVTEPSMVIGLHEDIVSNKTEPVANVTDARKDMYVIHAMVYQVGIITNSTNNETENNIGKQEALTFFHSNGSKVDFSHISQPILTNVTAQSVVGIVPSSSTGSNSPLLTNISNHWNLLQHESNGVGVNEMQAKEINRDPHKLYKRDNAIKENATVKIVKGSALIPGDAGIHSIAIPPLLALNNNFTNIPIPIPNTSIVHYAKINTLVHNPEV